MNLTIHTNHELSDEVKMLIEGIGQAELDLDIDLRNGLEDALEEQGFLIAGRSVNSESQKVDIYISVKR